MAKVKFNLTSPGDKFEGSDGEERTDWHPQGRYFLKSDELSEDQIKTIKITGNDFHSGRFIVGSPAPEWEKDGQSKKKKY